MDARGGENLREHLAAKYGTTPEGSDAARARLTELRAELGFEFDFFDEMRVLDTFKAHQLLRYARERGKELELEQRLLSAYFAERKDIDSVEVLTAEAIAVGLDGDEARQVLEDKRYADQVRAEQRYWLDLGVTGVPTSVVDRRNAISGALDPQTLARLLRGDF